MKKIIKMAATLVASVTGFSAAVGANPVPSDAFQAGLQSHGTYYRVGSLPATGASAYTPGVYEVNKMGTVGKVTLQLDGTYSGSQIISELLSLNTPDQCETTCASVTESTIKLTLPSATPEDDITGSDLTYANGTTTNLLPGTYGTIISGLNSTLNLDAGTQTNYFIHRIQTGNNVVLNLAPGDYWVDELVLGLNNNLVVNGTGTVRLFLKTTPRLGNETTFNTGQSPDKLFIYARDNFKTGNAALFKFTASAFIYAAETVDIGTDSSITGSVAARNITIRAQGSVTEDRTTQANIDWGDIGVYIHGDTEEFVRGEKADTPYIQQCSTFVDDIAYNYQGQPAGKGDRPYQLNCLATDNPPDLLADIGCMSGNSKDFAQGIIPFTINSPLWSDGAEKDRAMNLPLGSEIIIHENGDWEMPIGTVLIKNFSNYGKILETRFMMRVDDPVATVNGAHRVDTSIIAGQSYGDYVVDSISLGADAQAGVYSFHMVPTKTGGVVSYSVELRLNGAAVLEAAAPNDPISVAYNWLQTVHATDPSGFYTFDFGNHLSITVRKDGNGTVNLWGIGKLFNGSNTIALEGNGATASIVNDVIDEGETFGGYIVESVDFTGTTPGTYTFHVADPQAGEVELRINGVAVQTLSYDWMHTVNASDRSTDYVFNFHDYVIIKVRKAGVGSMNLYGINQSIFDGVQSVTAVAGPQRVGRWRGYTYQWNDTETGATLIKDDGDLAGEDWDDNWAVVDRAVSGNLFGNEVWRYPSSVSCYECHGGYRGLIKEPVDTPTAFDSFVPGYETLDNSGMTYSDFAKVASIGPETAQMNLTCENEQGLQANQFDTMVAMGMFMESTLPATWEPALKLIDPKHDLLEPLEDRARSYIHANCSHCHRKQPDGFGPGTEDFRFHLNNGLGALNHANISWPADFFDIWAMGCADNKLLVAGKPERSILSLRVNTDFLPGFPLYGSPLKMPYTGVIIKDQLGIALIDAWIKSGLGLFDPVFLPDSDGDGYQDNVDSLILIPNAKENNDLYWQSDKGCPTP